MANRTTSDGFSSFYVGDNFSDPELRSRVLTSLASCWSQDSSRSPHRPPTALLSGISSEHPSRLDTPSSGVCYFPRSQTCGPYSLIEKLSNGVRFPQKLDADHRSQSRIILTVTTLTVALKPFLSPSASPSLGGHHMSVTCKNIRRSSSVSPRDVSHLPRATAHLQEAALFSVATPMS